MPTKPKMRFPDSVLTPLLAEVKPSDDSPREHARARGANMARAWVCWIYGAALAPKISFPFELPAGHKPPKAQFALLLDHSTQAFEQHYRFDRSNGTAQVRVKDIKTNEAYGFWDTLHCIAERHDLWDLLNQELKKATLARIKPSGWTRIKPQECDLCSKPAQWAHPEGGFRCDKCPRPEK